MLILDVGTGENPRGDINTDISIGKTKHFIKKGYGLKSGCINPKRAKIPNFIQCDGCYLPFRNKTFDLVRSSHVLEHVPNWQLFFTELIRVCKYKVRIAVPHKLGRTGKFLFYNITHPRVHINFFDMKFWHIFLEGKYRYILSLRHELKHDSLIELFLPFLCPIEIIVEIWK